MCIVHCAKSELPTLKLAPGAQFGAFTNPRNYFYLWDI